MEVVEHFSSGPHALRTHSQESTAELLPQAHVATFLLFILENQHKSICFSQVQNAKHNTLGGLCEQKCKYIEKYVRD